MSISVVIPTYTLNRDLETMAYNCAKGYKEFADELIICEDGGRPSEKLQKLADWYIFHSNWGFTENVNEGWKSAKSDYTFIVNSDTYIESGNYRDLLVPGRVTSPKMAGHTRQGTFLNGAFFVVPKEIYKERGPLNPALKMYYSDDEYYERVKDIFLQVDSVVIRHVYSATLSHLLPERREEESERDRKIYEEVMTHGIHNR